MRKRKNKNRKFLTIIGVVLLAVVACGYCFFFAGMSSTGETQYVYVDNDDDIDSVYTKLSGVSSGSSMIGFKTLVSMLRGKRFHGLYSSVMIRIPIMRISLNFMRMTGRISAKR